MKPKCALCSKEIGYNEHYFIIRKRTVCRECGVRIRHDSKNNHCGVVFNGHDKDHTH